MTFKNVKQSHKDVDDLTQAVMELQEIVDLARAGKLNRNPVFGRLNLNNNQKSQVVEAFTSKKAEITEIIGRLP